MTLKETDEGKHNPLFVSFLLSSVVKQPAIFPLIFLSELDISFSNSPISME